MQEDKYYSEKLSAERLKQCYDIVNERIKQYLSAEINFVLNHIKKTDIILELGCGYGRVLKRLAPNAAKVFGIDTSKASLNFAREYLTGLNNIELLKMNVKALEFPPQTFDVVLAIQNGISAFKVAPEIVIQESLRVTKHKGKVLLSSYSEKIWEARLEWFLQQAKAGLLGEIDLEKTGNGVIIGKDGFRATTFSREDFQQLVTKLGLEAIIEEVDNSSIFCVITVNHAH